MVFEAQRISVEQFDRWVESPENADKLFEFIGGEIVEMPSNAFVSKISQTIAGYIFMFLLAHDIGHLTGEAGGYKVAGERYAPDVGFVSYDKQRHLDQQGYNSVPPDLAVEVDFPSTEQSLRNLRIKLGNYLSEGTVVWLVYPQDKTVEVFVPSQPVKILGENDTIDGGAVLPGFTLAVRDIFRD